LQGETLTIRDPARRLGISSGAASLVAESLISAGAAERYQDTLDHRIGRLVATGAGIQLGNDYRATQVEILEMLLGKLDPDRQRVLVLAMKEIAEAMDWAPIPSVEKTLVPHPKQLTAN
jgi:DNA-binding MarR family transcriptional regulator